MKNNNIIGFALIGIVLLLFSWYNSNQFEKQRIEQARLDSIATANLANQLAETNATFQADSVEIEEVSSIYGDQYLDSLTMAEEQFIEISNNKINVTLSSKGAQISNVLIKGYYTYDSLALNLIKTGESNFDMEFITSQGINTSDLNFTLAHATDSSAIYRLYFDDDSYVENSYLLTNDSYLMTNNLRFVNMNQYIPRSQSRLRMSWDVNIPRIEKGYKNEKQYSKVAYKYPNSNDVENLTKNKDHAQKAINQKVSWFAVQQQFFSAILVAPNDISNLDLTSKFYPEGDENLMACNALMMFDVENRESEFSVPLQFYFGPNHYNTLKQYDKDFEELLPLGGWLIGSISKFIIIPIFNWLSKFISNYGIIILILTILLKIAISPLTLKSYVSSAKMRVIKPEVDKINAKYPKPEDAMKKQQATMDLYKKCGISMFGGCLPMLLQLPLLYAMFRFFPASFELRQQSFLWAEDLSTYDSILDLGFNIPLYGDHISLFALLMAVTMVVYSKMNNAQMADSQAMPGMKFMTTWFMPIFLLVLCNNFSSGLSYYYMLSNLLTILQTWIIRKFFVDEDKLYAKIQAKAAAAPTKKKSNFQKRLEEAYKIQQAQERERQNQNRR